MLENEARKWLRREVQEHLYDFGPLGLYEIVWTLNGSDFELTSARKRVLAEEVAAEVVEEGTAELRILAWPGQQVISERLALEKIRDDDSWREGDQFVALVPIEPVAPPR